MAFSTKSTGGPMADINITPLIDVMLVLLIIFMVTAPIPLLKIKIDLPQPNPNPPTNLNPPEPVNLSIDQSGALSWNNTPVDESGLKAQFAVIAQQPQDKQPEIQIKAADAVAYQYVATVLADAKQYNLVKIGFTDSSGQ
ncbi:biopolymer transporter ExbD [Rhodanobacter sp. DHG33]|uniref:ExbD/TolR family protein n=1 Tax=Rhodanobacter sp. DHG33 TaxID=2775921 RepID=UPI0017867298|nr:biopolymer transporter ExbD [Rhodanobacter sp. DHG33]MBD8898753.1 biopolymer transporter ExbD [Rhodanobacter sp. DHG33]